MDAVSQRRHVVVTGAHDKACVRRDLHVQANKVPAIKGHHRSPRRHRERDDSSVCDALACLVRGENVVAKLTQALDHGRAKILISIETGHRLRFRCLLDGLLNLFSMGGVIIPGGCQIR